MLREGVNAVKIRHRSGENTTGSYGGIPIHAAESVHKAVVELLRDRLLPNAAVADIGAGQGALSQRLHDAGFNVTAFDLSSEEWRSRDVVCRECDFNGSLEQIGQHGPFAALCAIEVIEQQKDVVMIHIGDGHSKEVLDKLYEEVHEPIA